MNPVLTSTRFVIDHSMHVRINQENIKKYAKTFKSAPVAHWLANAPFDFSSLPDPKKLNFLLVFNSINSCYWGEPKWTIQWNGKQYDGSLGMTAALGRALADEIPITDFSYLAKLTREQLAHILRANVEIPLFDERYHILRQLGKTMTEKFNGNFHKLMNGQTDVLALIDEIPKQLPSFNDTSPYKNKTVLFQKRTQVLLADLAHSFPKLITNVADLSPLADYKLPQVLRKEGILEYTPTLAKKVDDKTELPAHSEEEVEIRANMVWAVQHLTDELKKRFPSLTAADVDHHLWLVSQKKSPDDKPYHRTRTTAY